MFIKPELINNIAILSTEKPVDFRRFKKFIKKSPYVRRIAFVGAAIFDMPEFVEMVSFCAVNNIWLIFGEIGKTSPEKLRALIEYRNVISINIYEEEEESINLLNEYKQQYGVDLPDINLIFSQKHTPQDDISATSYAFYNLADDMQHIGCLNLLEEPMLNHEGELLGCWQNPDKKHPINVFNLGMEKAFNRPEVKKILTMLKTGKICKSCPCTRCPVFASMVWSGKKLDVFKCLF